MGILLLKLLVALAVVVGSVLYFEGYLGDTRDPFTGDRTCRRAPDEIEAWSNHYAKIGPEDLERLAKWAQEHPDRVNRPYGVWCRTALHAAAEYGREDAARVLLTRGADVSAHDEYGDSPLHRAAWNGHLAMVELLLAHGAEVDAVDDGGGTPLHEVMLTTRPENDLQKRLVIARALLDGGADPNAPNGSSRFTPLRQAVASRGDPALARLLLERGANPDAADAQGGTPLDEAAAGGNLEAVQLLLDRGAGVDGQALAAAAARGHVEVARILLDRGADPGRPGDPRLPWHGTPLAMALLSPAAGAESGQRRLEIASLLVERGADITIRNGEGRTLLHGAAEEGNRASVEFLLDHGAESDAADDRSRTPLHAAVQEGHLDIVELLLGRGADPRVAAADGTTPLGLARNDPEMEALLRRHGG